MIPKDMQLQASKRATIQRLNTLLHRLPLLGDARTREQRALASALLESLKKDMRPSR